jgi:Raf kinase inhibitor-like YbhB/YbcL family protein
MSAKRHIAYLGLLGGLLMAGVCWAQTQSGPFTLTSSTFKDGEMLQVKNAGNLKANPNCVGENMSPPLAWTNVPAGTKSFVIHMFDPEGRNGLGVVHWIAYGIPASVTSFAEGEVSKESSKYVGGKSTSGRPFYVGPCTPPGVGKHHYVFTLIATDLEPTALKPGLTAAEVFAALAGHTKGAAGLIGLFQKP